ncbi:hypothetical protein [Methanoculleus sp. 10]|jgi:hypothetical protein|uniref:hypothetical protein n=1 Tax=Methanoculleus sp. 10 TaxID=430615 RepID=UPI0025FA2720|nr:hypothetical protein [Methanoculleus sp. 10]
MEKTSIRGVAQVTGHHQGTITRYYRLIGEHAEHLSEFFQQSLSLGGIKLDELWIFVQKSTVTDRKIRSAVIVGPILLSRAVQGLSLPISAENEWRQPAHTSSTRFLRSFRCQCHLPRSSVATDENSQYREGLAKLYWEPCISYGQVIKQREENRLVAVIQEAIWENPVYKTVSTSVVEGYNNMIRRRISRFRRKTASFAKKIVAYIAR